MLAFDALPAAPHAPITMHDVNIQCSISSSRDASKGQQRSTAVYRDARNVTRGVADWMESSRSWESAGRGTALLQHSAPAAHCCSRRAGRTCAQHEGSRAPDKKLTQSSCLWQTGLVHCALHDLLPGVLKDGHIGCAVGRPQRVLKLAAKLRVYRADGLEGVGQDALVVQRECYLAEASASEGQYHSCATYAVYEAPSHWWCSLGRCEQSARLMHTRKHLSVRQSKGGASTDLRAQLVQLTQ